MTTNTDPRPPRVYQVLGLLRYLWNADIEMRRAIENDGGKVRDLFDVSDPLRVEIDDLLGPEDDDKEYGAAWAARDAWDAWAAWDAWDALTVEYAALNGWITDSPDLLTKRLRDAYRHGAAVVLPVGNKTLGYAMEEQP